MYGHARGVASPPPGGKLPNSVHDDFAPRTSAPLRSRSPRGGAPRVCGRPHWGGSVHKSTTCSPDTPCAKTRLGAPAPTARTSELTALQCTARKCLEPVPFCPPLLPDSTCQMRNHRSSRHPASTRPAPQTAQQAAQLARPAPSEICQLTRGKGPRKWVY